jgi:hypothetical protein
VRVLVAAPFPPAPDEAASVALAAVEQLLAEGHTVDVISPLPSAAGLHGPLAGWRGALGLARRARRYDALHLVVSRRILFLPELPQARRIFDSVALSLALRRWKSTSADLGDLSDVPGGGGGLSGRIIWRSIGTLFVSGELVRNHAVKVLGFPADRVKVRPSPGRREAPGIPGTAPVLRIEPPGAQPPWTLTAPADWDAVMAEIRSRAAAERARLAGPPA